MRLLLLLAAALSLTEGVMVCYYGSWAVYRQGDGKFDVEDIDPAICTHLIFGFAGVAYNYEIRVLDPFNELCENYGKCGYDRFCKLKEKSPDTKTLLAVGGWNEGSTKYSEMAADPAKRSKFITSSIQLLKDHGFDGLDLDWEYPCLRGGKPEDRANFLILLEELRDSLHAEGMMLTVAVGAGKEKMDLSYDMAKVAETVDLVNLMSYDLHGAWDTYTHHQSGLYPHPMDEGENAYLNQDFAVNYWIDHGCPAEKLVLGVPLYGRCWQLDSPSDTGYYAPASRPAAAGTYTRQAGFMGYNEICESMLTTDWTVVNDPAMHEPYAYCLSRQNTWCSYDDHNSCITKAEYAKAKGLAGVMIWSIETDDFKGKCAGSREFDLIKTLYETFSGKDVPTLPPQPTQSTTTPDPFKTTRPTPSPEGHCLKPGLNSDPDDCTHYFDCVQNEGGTYLEFEEFCPPGLLFNPKALICDWDYSVCGLEEDVCPNDC